MSLESATKISELVATNPSGTDPVSQGDDHIRMIKNVLQLDAYSKSADAVGLRNIIINGNMKINQRGVTIAAADVGSYGPDRWKKVDASNMTQIVEEFNYRPSTVYTLSGTGVTTQQITSPASGHWTLPNIPIAATDIQLEEGSIATPFERRPIGLELSLCQRYYSTSSNSPAEINDGGNAFFGICTLSNLTTVVGSATFPVAMRTNPTITGYDDTGASGTVSQPGVVDGIAYSSIETVSKSGFNGIILASAGSSGYPVRMYWTASAEL